ncbi:MAG: CoA transferase, partial [Alphaproteobacteria bacterium]|nr:CoA transferase [Alphaproteobacteria bacterium]
PSITPFEVFDTKDGHLIIAAGNDSLFVKLAHGLGKPAMAEDARYKTNDLRNRHVDALKSELEAVLKTDTTAHWIEVLDKAGVPAGPINNVGQAIEHRQSKARNMVITVDDPVAGAMRLVGNPIKLSGFVDPPTRRSAPDLDSDRARIKAELAM